MKFTVFAGFLEYCKKNALWQELFELSKEAISKYPSSFILLYFKAVSALKLKNIETFNVTFGEIKSKYPDAFEILESEGIENHQSLFLNHMFSQHQ